MVSHRADSESALCRKQSVSCAEVLTKGGKGRSLGPHGEVCSMLKGICKRIGNKQDFNNLVPRNISMNGAN